MGGRGEGEARLRASSNNSDLSGLFAMFEGGVSQRYTHTVAEIR